MDTTIDSDTLRVETAIGLDPAALPVLPFPEKQDAVFADGFEGGNWNAWSSATGTSKLAVNAAAALEGITLYTWDDNGNLLSDGT